MHLIYASPDFTMLFTIIGGIAAFSVIVAVTSSVKSNKLARMYGSGDGPAKTFNVVAIVAIVIALLAGLSTIFIQRSILRDYTQTLKEDRIEWVESHGVTTQSSTITDLEFPADAPDEDAKFGVAQVVADDNSIVSVHLAWEDGDFVLYGTDGEPMERLDQ